MNKQSRGNIHVCNHLFIKRNQGQSDAFYQEVSDFTDEVLAEMDILAYTAVDGYVSYLGQRGSSKLHSREEYGFELLVLGTFWEIYSGDANGLDEVPQQLLTDLAMLRRQGGALKPGIDFIRGMLSTIFLSPDLYDHMFKLDASLKHLDKLLDWLTATGEFNQETLRLRQWEGIDFAKMYIQKQSNFYAERVDSNLIRMVL